MTACYHGMRRKGYHQYFVFLQIVGQEYKGNIEHHAFELFLSIEGIEHTTTKAYSPQTNGMCERFNKTMKHEFFDTAMRKRFIQILMIYN